jgi:hypothetical protein
VAVQPSRLWARVTSSQPGGVGEEPARGVVTQPAAVLGVADGELDDGVAAVVGVQLDRGADPVGHQRVVAPGREQLLLVIGVRDAAHDEAVAAKRGLGDLRDPVRGGADVDPGSLADAGDLERGPVWSGAP